MTELVQYNANTSTDAVKPPLYNGVDYDFNQLTDRNFEVLLYRIFKNRIENSDLAGNFEQVMLMTGVRDKGQDCALFYDGKQVGLIQCKKYNQNISTNQVVEEVLKFVLYSIEDKRIFSANNEDKFTYYFAVSKGFANDANTYIGTFNDSIANEIKIEEYIIKLTEKYQSISHLKFSEIEVELKEKLSKIIIKPILPVDIQGWLKENCSSILSDFFKIEMVVDQKLLEGVQKELVALKEVILPSANTNRLINEFQDASSLLESISNSFSNIADSHIERPEVDQIYNWVIEESHKANNLALVVGIAGCGKSVIIKDLLLRCKNREIPVLGLKSDRQKANSITELKDQLNFTSPIIDSIRQLASINERVVILIDQIDALSQYLSTKRDFIDTYTFIINALRSNPKIKIIVSTRKFDLDNDPDIKKLEEGSIVYNIGLLNEGQVDDILKRMSINPQVFNKQLLQLLRIPVNLDLFCRIYDGDTYKMDSVKTVYDLYSKFWDEKILKEANNKRQVIELLSNIAQDMYNQQSLDVGKRKYEDFYFEELVFLKSSNVLIVNNETLSFFHQSFYDFVFGRSFIASGGNILRYIKDQDQSITIRAGLKIILSYLREYDLSQYISTIGTIILESEYKFHLKYLVYAILGSTSNPTQKEIVFVEEHLETQKELLEQFLLLCVTAEWGKWIFENNILASINDSKCSRFNVVLSVIYNFLNLEPDLVINYIKQNRHLTQFSDENLIDILSALQNWTEDALILIKELIPEFSLSNERHIHILMKISETYPKFIFENIAKGSVVLDKKNCGNSSMSGFYQNKLFDKLMKNSPNETCTFLYELIDNIIVTNKVEKYRYGNFITDKYFQNYYPNIDDKDSSDLDGILDKLLRQLSYYAKVEPKVYDAFYNRLKDSQYYTWNLILTASLENATDKHGDKIVYTLNTALQNDEYGTYDTLHYLYWKIIHKSFPILSTEYQEEIINIITQINLLWERKFSNYNGRLSYPHLHYTSYFFLRAIPLSHIKDNKKLYKHYNELIRKYGDKDNESWDRSVGMAHFVGAPLSSIAYERMSNKQWKKSFHKYNSEYRRDFFSEKGHLKVGTGQHSSTFKSVVQNNPEKYYDLVYDITFDNTIDTVYKINGLWGFVDGEIERERIFPLYIEISKLELCSSNTMYMMWMARKLCKTGPLPDKIFNYVVNVALKHNESRKDNYGISHSINSVQGSAIPSIIFSYDNPLFHGRIFDVLSEIIETGKESSKLSILMYVAYLNHVDIEKAFALLISCVTNTNDETFKAASHSLPYYYQYFGKLMIFYKQSIKNCTDKENRRTLVIYICHAWLNEDSSAKDLLDLALSQWKTCTVKAIIEVAFGNVVNPNYRSKCFELLYKFIDEDDKEIKEAYLFGFLRNEDIDLILIYEFIQHYTSSPCFDRAGHYFFEYLFCQSKKYPEMVLDIMNTIDFTTDQLEEIRHRENETLIQVVLGSLNSIRGSKRRYRLMATDILDSILFSSRNYHYIIRNLDESLM